MTMTVSQSSMRRERGSSESGAATGTEASVTGPWGGVEDIGAAVQENKQDRAGRSARRCCAPGAVTRERALDAAFPIMRCVAMCAHQWCAMDKPLYRLSMTGRHAAGLETIMQRW